jgi:hypothetical protein
MARRIATRVFRSVNACALFLYGVVAVGFTWPLALHLRTALPGNVGGDTGVYVWNLWVFRHELVVHGRFPLFTNEVLGLTPSVDLSLHNYTVFADLLAVPLIPVFGVVGSFNVLALSFIVISAWAMFALARALVGRAPEAWLAGLLFAFSPLFTARLTEHFSLASAAPLPLFILAMHRGFEKADRRYAVLAGAVAGWAAMWDAYYGIFCVLIAAVYLAAQYLRIERSPSSVSRPWLRRSIDIGLVLVAVEIAVIVGTGGTVFTVLGQTVAMRSLYSPVLIATVLVLLRLYLSKRPVIRVAPLPPLKAVAETMGAAAAACIIVLSPLLIALSHSLEDGATFHGPMYWRSSPPGIDVMTLLVPNPNHPWFGAASRGWVAAQPNGFAENVVSLSLVACVVMALAWWRYRPRVAAPWLALTAAFGALALGPFVHVAGINTYVPGPWALLRYVPVVSAARMPTRFAIPFTIGFAVLFAVALTAIAARRPLARRTILAVVAVLLVIELLPAPRPLYSARVPEVFDIVARDPRNVRVLMLPFGFRSGEWSEGNYTAATQFFQTYHQKGLIGGYLSRISRREIQRQHQSLTVSTLVALSEKDPLPPENYENALSRGAGFITRNHIGYVVFQTATISQPLREFALRAFRLRSIAAADGFELYVPEIDEQQVSKPPIFPDTLP